MKSIIFDSDEKFLTVEHLYTIEKYLTMQINIRSGEFSGASNFCMPSEKLLSIIQELRKMNNTLSGRCSLNDYDSDAHINFEMGELGHLRVSGQIGGSHESHFMKFKYVIDQTILQNLIKTLEIIL